MDTLVNILLVGAGGYGASYVKELMSITDKAVRFVAVIDPYLTDVALIECLKGRGVQVFSRIEEFRETGQVIDLTIVASPIHTHYMYVTDALNHSSHVLCEKPVVFDTEQFNELVRLEKMRQRFVAVGFQQCFDSDVQILKKDIATGVFGKPLRMKALRMMRRGDQYYSRNNWAGKRFYDGSAVFDSPVSNSCAHQLQTMLYLLGKTQRESVGVKHLEGNVYRAREGLEMFDAAALRVESTIDVPIYFYTALCIEEKKIGPMAELVFEKATVQYDGENFISLWDDGKKTLYERDEDASSMKKLYDCITAVRNNDTPCCVLNSVKSHMDVVIALQDIEVQTVASVDYLTDTGERVQVIPGGIDQFEDAYKQWSMPNIENISGNA
ncbi:MAG: Gfo/Idh/MocA family protein [Sphaerochaeta sp.]|jgi:predicted dehydrogenase